MGGDGHHEEDTLEPASQPVPPHQPHQLEPIFRQHDKRVFRAAYRITGSAQDAEDVLQTVFLRLIRHPQLPDQDGIGNYLYRAAINTALDVVRKRRHLRVVSIEDMNPESLSADVEDAASREKSREIRDLLRQELAGLNSTAAEMFALRYFEDHNNQRIAEILGTSKSVVAVTLHRTRTKLHQRLRNHLGGKP